MVEQQARDAADRADRRAELVAHVGQEAALELGGLAQLLGLGVEFGVERDHAAVGFLELGSQRVAPPARLAASGCRDGPAARRRAGSSAHRHGPPPQHHDGGIVACRAMVAHQDGRDHDRVAVQQHRHDRVEHSSASSMPSHVHDDERVGRPVVIAISCGCRICRPAVPCWVTIERSNTPDTHPAATLPAPAHDKRRRLASTAQAPATAAPRVRLQAS